MYPLLAAMLTARPWDEISSTEFGSLSVKPDDADRAMIHGYVQRYLFDITEMLNTVPRQVPYTSGAPTECSVGQPSNVLCLVAGCGLLAL